MRRRLRGRARWSRVDGLVFVSLLVLGGTHVSWADDHEERDQPFPTPTVEVFPSVAAAVEASLPADTVVVAFGELHQRAATARVRSTLSFFTRELLPVLAPRLGYLVLETWVTTGSCGEDEKAAVAEVEAKTERPKHVENELVTLVTRAKDLGVSPQILNIDCAAYKAMRGTATTPGLDFEKTLAITTDALTKKIEAVLAARQNHPDIAQKRPLVAVYGGALHNDRFPVPDLAAYSFASPIDRRVSGAYVEIDLMLPSLIEASARMLASEPWFGAYRRRAKKHGVLRIARGPRSYVVVPLGAGTKASEARP